MELHMNRIFKEYKAWALVTGAASGMGRIYAVRLARMGYDLVLVDINGRGLEETEALVKAEVAASDKVPVLFKDDFRIITIVQNLSRQDAADVIFTPLMLCRKYVVGMKERGCGYILNIPSLAECMSWPGIGMYGATKRFVKDYSRELRIECQKTGVSVTNAYFGAVDTPLVPLKDSLRKLARGLAVMISPERAVDCALRATFRRRKGVMPGVLNHIFRPLCRILPDCLLGWIYRKAKPYLMKV